MKTTSSYSSCMEGVSPFRFVKGALYYYKHDNPSCPFETIVVCSEDSNSLKGTVVFSNAPMNFIGRYSEGWGGNAFIPYYGTVVIIANP